MLGDSVRRRSPPQRRPTRPPARRSVLPRWGWKVWTGMLLVALAVPFLIGYLLATVVLFPPPEVGPGGIAVPSLVGRTEADAARELAAAGLGTLAVTRLPHPERPTGMITAQSPLPGQQLAAGTDVHVAVSSGIPRAVVPDVVGFTEGRAAALLQRLGFQVNRVMEDSDEPAGRILRTQPEPGREAALPAAVTLYVSRGPLGSAGDSAAARFP